MEWGDIVFWCVVSLTAIWTWGVFTTEHGGSMMGIVTTLWAICIAFYFVEINRLHLLWVVPVACIGQTLIEAAFRRQNR